MSTPSQAWYAEYLASDHWIRTRNAKLEAAGYQCEECGEWGRRDMRGNWLGLHVHHLTYERVGKERPDDLRVLCIACHEEAHGKPTPGRREHIRMVIVNRIVSQWDADPWNDGIQDELDYYDKLIEKGSDL